MNDPKIPIPHDRIRAFCNKPKARELSLFDARDERAAIFGRRVDLIDREGLRYPYFRRSIPNSRRVLHAA